MNKAILKQAPLYDVDRLAWLENQAALARAGRSGALDLENLAEELDVMVRSERRELRNRLVVLLVHLLKHEFQPAMRSGSWRGSIVEQRRRIRDTIEESPSLRRWFADLAADPAVYTDAVEQAAAETGLPPNAFPQICPYGAESIMDPSFWPGA
ncbi:DUF29 domain-containing protein [Azospirillum sp. SYSU D00513]|uniref:DUF29 domain-containing protein n=1 Tax=Azospirillum sp. SYSU D00513 TaxID=2812561 RepID=UPI001A978C88|nr:DUF29 domain-containing protein [Azospirillum sp. SYSU D00513]